MTVLVMLIFPMKGINLQYLINLYCWNIWIIGAKAALTHNIWSEGSFNNEFIPTLSAERRDLNGVGGEQVYKSLARNKKIKFRQS